MNLSIQSFNLVSDGWNFIKLLLDIYGNGVIIHIKLSQDVCGSHHLPFDCFNINDFVSFGAITY